MKVRIKDEKGLNEGRKEGNMNKRMQHLWESKLAVEN